MYENKDKNHGQFKPKKQLRYYQKVNFSASYIFSLFNYYYLNYLTVIMINYILMIMKNGDVENKISTERFY